MLLNYRTGFFLIYCVGYCVYLHTGISLLKHRTERVAEYLTIRYCMTFFLKTKKIIILLYLSSCAVETVPVPTRIMELQLCMTKIYSKVSNAIGKVYFSNDPIRPKRGNNCPSNFLLSKALSKMALHDQDFMTFPKSISICF